jgi:hypothetical protein
MSKGSVETKVSASVYQRLKAELLSALPAVVLRHWQQLWIASSVHEAAAATPLRHGSPGTILALKRRGLRLCILSSRDCSPMEQSDAACR